MHMALRPYAYTGEWEMKKYQRIEDSIIQRINTGKLIPGEKLEDTDTLCKHFQVSHITIQKALESLSAQGYITRIKGKGSFIKDLPNNAAHSYRIVFLLAATERSDPSLLQIISGAQKIANDNRCSLFVELAKNKEEEQNVLMRNVANSTDGFLFYVSSHASLDTLVRQCGKPLPYVIIDHCDRSIPCNYVSPNNLDGGFLATEYLIQKGHRLIAFVSNKYSRMLNTDQDRFAGYKMAMQYYHLPPVSSPYLLDNEQHMVKLTQSIKAKKITALFFVNDQSAMMAEHYFTQQGIRIPEDVSLIGFDDYEPSQYALVPLTTIKQDFCQLGEVAMQVLLNCLYNQGLVQFQKNYLPLRITERASVRELENE